MANCLISAGIAAPSCDTKFGLPGIKRKAFVTNFEDISSFTETIAGEISAITFKSTKGLFELFCKDNVSNTQSESFTDAPSGLYYTQTLSLRVIEKSTATRNTIEDMLDTPLVALIEESDGQWKLYGETRGVKLTKSVYTTGSVPGDENGWLLTLEGFNLGEVKKFFDTNKITTDTKLQSYKL